MPYTNKITGGVSKPPVAQPVNQAKDSSAQLNTDQARPSSVSNAPIERQQNIPEISGTDSRTFRDTVTAKPAEENAENINGKEVSPKTFAIIDNRERPQSKWYHAPVIPDYKNLIVKQGQVGSCYALASMIGICSNPDACDKIRSACEVSKDGFTITLTPDFLRPNSESKTNLKTILLDQSNIDQLKDKGYEVTVDSYKTGQDGFLKVKVTPERCREIFVESDIDVKTNSLLINFVEHFVGNLIALGEGVGKGLDRVSSPKMHSDRRNDRYNELICNLFDYKAASINIDGGDDREIDDREIDDGDEISDDDEVDFYNASTSTGNSNKVAKGNNISSGAAQHLFEPTNSASLRKALEYFDTHNIGAEQCNQNGFVFTGYDYGELDQFGIAHGRHALTLNKVIKDEDGTIIGMEVINPWGDQRGRSRFEELSLDDAIQRHICLILYVPEHSE